VSGRAALIEPSRVLPDKWLAASAAIGPASACAKTLHAFIDGGADRIVMHGTTAGGLEGTVKAFVAGSGS
jgi:NAD(P)H-dependent flavin oxidoreductase YrpB (nitropropane dioxygenase family)